MDMRITSSVSFVTIHSILQAWDWRTSKHASVSFQHRMPLPVSLDMAHIFIGDSSLTSITANGIRIGILSSVSPQYGKCILLTNVTNIGKFIYDNYRQALKIIREYTPELDMFKQLHGITDSDFVKWHEEQISYLKSLKKEPEEDVLRVEYFMALSKLEKAE